MTTTVTIESIADRIREGQCDQVREALDSIEETDENRVDLMFLRGYLQEQTYDREAALNTYDAVLKENPDHTEAMFRAALLCDQGGDDNAAIELYERCTEMEPVHVNALINLAVLYEEAGELARAEACLFSVLEEYPNHFRARHFLQSVESSSTMVYDEHMQRERERRHAVLDVPISDFELSVRSRNCLRQMNIKTLGDLLRITESELLSYKNFGETSLNEIKEMLTQKGLKLGQGLQLVEQPTLPTPVQVSTDFAAHVSKPIVELELSVRSRKALQRLGITTLSELSMRTEAELMTIKNFGQTSLSEIQQQLAKYGMSLGKSG